MNKAFPKWNLVCKHLSFFKNNKTDIDETKKTDEVTALNWDIYWLWWGKGVSLSVNLIFSAVLAYMSNIYPEGFTERWETNINALFVTLEVIWDEKLKTKVAFEIRLKASKKRIPILCSEYCYYPERTIQMINISWADRMNIWMQIETLTQA